MKKAMQEYIDLLYNKYNSLNIELPVGSNINFNETLIEQLTKKRQTALVLSSNSLISDQQYKHFCQVIGTNPVNTIMGFYEFHNGSLISFKSYDQVQKQIYDQCNVIILNSIYLSCSELSLEFAKKVKKINKRITINCTLDKILFDDNTHTENIKTTNLSYIKQLIRKNKLQKIKDQMYKLEYL